MNKAPYSAKIDKTLKDKFVTFANQGQELYFSLPSYPETTVSAQKETVDQDWSGKVVKYSGALDGGLDIEILLNNGSLKKYVVINSLEALGDLTGKEYYEVSFLLTSNREVNLKADGKLISSEGTITTSGRAEIIDDQGVTSYIWPPYVKDSSGKYEGSISIQIEYKQTNDGILLTKKLPVEWLKKATFPVKTDATVSYYVGLGNGASRAYESTWNAAHDASSGDNDTSYVGSPNWLQIIVSSGYYLSRTSYPIDTSGMPDEAEISSADLHLYLSNLDWDQNGDYIGLVQTTQASPSELVDDDFDQCGAVDSPEEGADRIDISGSLGWTAITLNATGTSWIDVTGWTKLGLRLTHDLDDSVPTGHTSLGFSATGSAHEPYLEIEYTYAYSDMRTEGEVNPSKVTDSFPEFYVTNANSSSVMYYQVQVATSSSYWDEPVWDSEKTSMATTTEGNRCPSITYGNGETDALPFDGSTYYWRIKFWYNDVDSFGWSEAVNFTMADSVRLVFP